MTNLADLLTDGAARSPESAAVRLDDLELSYAELDRAAGQAAGLLEAKGVSPGDRVGVMLPNVPYFAVVYYGILRAGGVVVPMNVLLKEREVAYYLGDAEARLLLAWHDFADAAHAGSDAAHADCLLVEPGAFEALLGR
jgi:long-chain acyl-CoA synthetase